VLEEEEEEEQEEKKKKKRRRFVSVLKVSASCPCPESNETSLSPPIPFL
jgi:hypothetical protein